MVVTRQDGRFEDGGGIPRRADGSTLYSVAEEIAHSVIHGIGALLGIAGLAILVAQATLHGEPRHVAVCSIFGATLVLMYTASTLYHSIPLPRAKRVLRAVDHASIYLLIAGTYTPFALILLGGTWGWILFSIVWTLAAAGVVFKVFATGRFEKLSLAIYLGMGWCAVLAAKPLIDAMPVGALALMIAGGLAYTGGVAFYLRERMRYHHAIWHLFVLAGSVLHYLAVFYYVIPTTA